jgi:hypothetical protein
MSHISRYRYLFIIVIVILLTGFLFLSCKYKKADPEGIMIEDTDGQEELPEEKELTGRNSHALPGILNSLTGNINIYYTYQSETGNRLTLVKADLASYTFTDISLEGIPVWIIAGQAGLDSIWAVIFEDGSNQVFKINTEDYFLVRELEGNNSGFDSSYPPVLVTNPNDFYLVEESYYLNNSLTHPVMLGPPYELAAINPGGYLHLSNDKYNDLPGNILSDSRIITDNMGYLYLLTEPTDEYAHGILGDKYEAGSITIIDSRSGYNIINKISMESGTVIESLYPIVFDVDGNGKNEIIVTLSNRDKGAWIAVFDLKGDLVMEGTSIGRGNRWRHQLAVAPFGPEGEIELVDVLTPHIGGVVEFYGFREGRLEILSSVEGYSSHKIGSRNLDIALAGDFDKDNQFEIMVPRQDFSGLGVLKHNKSGASVLFELESGAIISTNIAAAADSSGNLLLGIGREDSVLRIWHKP